MSSGTLDERFAFICSMEGPLSARLQAFDQTLHDLGLPSARGYESLVATLQAGEATNRAPRIVDEMPDFLLPDADGHLVSLSSLVGHGRLVISFNRGHWCQFCQLELAAFRDAHREFAIRGVTVAAILPERLEYIRMVRDTSNQTVIALSDMDNSYALELGLAVWVGQEVIEIYKSIGWDLPRFQGNDMWFVPVPATFVIEEDRCIIARHVDPDFRRRMEIDEILSALD